jgi:fructose-1,6-bisphosphatase/inositol monophosphatase family enzyme
MHLTTIEKQAIEAFRKGGSGFHKTRRPDTSEDWLRFGLVVLLKVGTVIRKARLAPMASQVFVKPDGSPVTRTDQVVESFVRNELAQFCPEANLVGEESGGLLPDTGPAMAIDPIDGTWAFINRTETVATSFLFFRDRDPFLGMVFNPVSGELGYGGEHFRSRILQMSMFGEGDFGYDLPLDRAASKSLLINFQPQRQARELMTTFYKMWQKREINIVRSPGGSPSLSLLEVSKGCFGYVNLWAEKPAAPYDLTAGILLVRCAGGDVLDTQGKPVQLLDHAGPFIGIIDRDAGASLIRKLRDSL